MAAPTQQQRQALADQLVESLRRRPAPFTPREVYGRTWFPGKATVVVGMRRAGKTTFLHQLRQSVEVEPGMGRSQVPFVSFEDERLAGLRGEQLGFIVEEFGRISGSASGAPLWCLDEIQLVPGWERFVRRLLDGGRARIVVSGSSAALLSREIATALRGRAWQVLMHPFSFLEVLRHRRVAIPSRPGDLDIGERAALERDFGAWLVTGGFPGAQGLDAASRHQLLRDYVDVAILRDVVERHRVTNVAGLRWLVRHLLGNAAGLFSVEKFHAALKSQGLAIGRDTVHQLLSHLEDCFLVRLVWMESKSERQRMVNPRKVYPVDPGLIPVFDRTGRANIGHALETAVLVELERRGCESTYVRTAEGYEVDFLTRSSDGHRQLIQVCADASDATTAARELRALAAASSEYPDAALLLLTLTRDGLPEELPAQVVGHPAYAWMLDAAERRPGTVRADAIV